MPITNIPSPRVDFIDERTPNKISAPWFYFLYELFRRVGGITSSVTITDVEETFLPVVTGTPTLSFIDNDRTPFTNHDVIPRPFIDENMAAFVMDFAARMDASLTQMRQQINDAQSMAELAPVATFALSTGSDVTLDCDTLEPVGYWSPVTDGASNIIYSGGQVVVAFTCTS